MQSGWGWRWFGAWVGAGILLAFSLVSALSIGLFVLPFALVALWAVARGSRYWPTALGLISGAGLVCLLIWALNRDYEPCPPGGISVSADDPSSSFTCGGHDPLPWLVAGIVLTLAGAVAFAVLRRLDRFAHVG